MLEAVKDTALRTPQRVPDLLTPEGVQAFLENPSPQARAEAAAVIAKEFASGSFSEEETELAGAILDTLASEGEEPVREALAEHLKDCAELPPDLARKIAADEVQAVAVPMLRCCPVLQDEDLIQIAKEGEVARQIALTKRAEISPELAEALVESRNEKVVGGLLGNKGADLPEPLLNRIIDDFGTFTAFHSLIVERPFLPVTVVARMLVLIADDLRERLQDRHELPPAFVHELSRVCRETSIQVGNNRAPKTPDVFKLVQALDRRHELPAILVLRALLTGDLAFFEAAMADRVQMGLDATRSLIYSGSPKGFKGLYARANMPADLMRAFRIAIDYVMEIGRDEAGYWRADFSEECLKGLSGEFDEFCPAELRRLLGRLQRRMVNEGDQKKRGSVELAFSKNGREQRKASSGAGRKGPLRPAS